MESRGKSNAGASHTRHGATMQEAGAYVLRRPASCELSAQPVHSIGGSPTTSAASALPARGGGRGVFPSPAALSGLARGLTELSGALLTIARALQQLAPHPATDVGALVTRAAEPAEAGNRPRQPKRGAEPRPASAPHARSKPGKWTPERRQLIQAMRADRKPAPEILEAVLALPGEPVTMQQMHAYAYSLGIRTGGPAPRSSKSWNAARDAVLREGWERGDESAVILAAVNAVPGIVAVLSCEAIKSRAEKLKLRRSQQGWRRCRDRANDKMRGVGRAWSEEMIAALQLHYPNKAMRLEAIAAALTEIAGSGTPVTISAVQQKAYELRIARPRGVVPKASAAAAAKVRDTSAPPAPKAAPAAPPAIIEIPRAELTNPAPGVAVSEGLTSCPDTQPRPAAVGAPRPPIPPSVPRIGSGGVRVDSHAPPAVTDEPPPYDPSRKSSVESRVERARELLRKGAEPHIVVMHTRLQLREVFRLQGEVRAERAA